MDTWIGGLATGYVSALVGVLFLEEALPGSALRMAAHLVGQAQLAQSYYASSFFTTLTFVVFFQKKKDQRKAGGHTQGLFWIDQIYV